jgi:glycosyltransferase involved in cell wall biosynthesis
MDPTSDPVSAPFPEPRSRPGAEPRRVGIVLKGYPRLSESFILREILLLESQGLELHLFALRDPGERTVHERVAQVRARVTYLPDRLLDALGDVIGANAARLAKAPRRTLAGFAEALVRSVRERDAAPLKRFLQAAVLLERALPGTGVTHLHAHFCNDPTTVAYFAHRLSGIPFSFSAHAKDIYTQPAEQLAAKLARARFVTTCTAANAEHLDQHAHGATPILLCYHGVETDRYRPAARDRAGVPHVLSVGRLVAKKGFPVLLDALAMLRDRGLAFRCTIVGTGPLEPRLREQRARLRLETQVELRGAMAEGALAAFYREVDVFALACEVQADGDRDGIPNVVVEAMACGLPVVSTNVSGLPECVEHGTTGLLVPARSPEALAAALAGLLANPESARALGRAGRAKVERVFAAERNVQPIAEALHDALEIPPLTEVAHAVGG